MRPVTLFSGQWADMPMETFIRKASAWGYDGIEIACSGDHLDVMKAAKDKRYCKTVLDKLACKNLKVWAISNHLAGQLVCDPDDDFRTDVFCPKKFAGKTDAKRKWAVEQMKYTAKAAENLGVEIVTGFTGSPIWHMLYSFPPVPKQTIDDGFSYVAEMWNPILDVFEDHGVKFALEVHPTEIAFDIVTAKRTLETFDYREEFGFNFDPSHLFWQMMDPVRFLQEFPDRIFHVHMKDAARTLDGRTGILSSHLDFGKPGRGWDFRSPGHGQINFEEIIRELNRIEYDGPLSVEWEDSGMEREFGAADACKFVRKCDFVPSAIKFDAAMNKTKEKA
ncbi:MAG: Inosose dehydratase [Lentisphaerae bacterium ADurb.Bin242]|nr:MAG: Inosose dehydratase [Lentisphaerae bacterium ADurb.Bin242]